MNESYNQNYFMPNNIKTDLRPRHQIGFQSIKKNRSFKQMNPEHETSQKKQLPYLIRSHKNIQQQTYNKFKTISYNNQQIQSLQSQSLKTVPPSRQELPSEHFIRKLDELDKKAEELIQNRLNSIIAQQSNKKAKNNMGIFQRDCDFQTKFQKLIRQVRSLKDDELKNSSSRDIQIMMNKKIKLLQKLMAQKSIEAQVLKKYYSSMGPLSKKRNPKGKLARILAKAQLIKNNPINQNMKSQVCNETWNKNSFRAPKADQYENYRYQHPQFKSNNQPLPRSSYKAQYLRYGTQDQKMQCRNIDTCAFIDKNRKQNGNSTYSHDYKILRTEPINYKQLDSYRNKIKNIQVSYMFKKGNSDDQLNNHKYLCEQSLQRALYSKKLIHSESKKNHKLLEKSLRHSRLNNSTESRSQYQGQFSDMTSQIKNKQLTNLRYQYKNYVHS